mgnify:CR=1 FL=1
METYPVHFIDEPIKVYFASEPLLEKDPACPQGFRWQDQDYIITEVLSEWRDYERKGKMAHNMIPEHARRAKLRGSWGVGRYYFVVRTSQGRIFAIYYDRAPKNVQDRKGKWILHSEQAQR